jgi:hypothetical protein
VPKAASRRQPGQPPFGAPAGFSPPHFGQSLITLLIFGDDFCLHSFQKKNAAEIAKEVWTREEIPPASGHRSALRANSAAQFVRLNHIARCIVNANDGITVFDPPR